MHLQPTRWLPQDKFQVYIENTKSVVQRQIGVALAKAERSLITSRRCVSVVCVTESEIKTQSLITRVQFWGSATITFEVLNVGEVFSVFFFYQVNIWHLNPMSSCLVINGQLKSLQCTRRGLYFPLSACSFVCTFLTGVTSQLFRNSIVYLV